MLLGGISENIYENTTRYLRVKARTGDALALELRNYMANYQGSNDGSLNVEEALTSLKKKRKELEQEIEQQQKAGEEEKQQLYSRLSYVEQDSRRPESGWRRRWRNGNMKCLTKRCLPRK